MHSLQALRDMRSLDRFMYDQSQKTELPRQSLQPLQDNISLGTLTYDLSTRTYAIEDVPSGQSESPLTTK